MIESIDNIGTTPGAPTKRDVDDYTAGGGMAFGFDWDRFGATIRSEVEFTHIVRLDYDSRPALNTLPNEGFENNVSITSVLLNLFYDIPLGSWYTPYVGFGVGVARNRSEVEMNNLATGRLEELTSETDNLAWALMAGMGFDITDNWFAELGYRFINTGELKFGQFRNGAKFQADDVIRHDVTVGFGYRF
jgi:outer membrane immunogenic protein